VEAGFFLQQREGAGVGAKLDFFRGEGMGEPGQERGRGILVDEEVFRGVADGGALGLGRRWCRRL
jgi:hypothetical protein